MTNIAKHPLDHFNNHLKTFQIKILVKKKSYINMYYILLQNYKHIFNELNISNITASRNTYFIMKNTILVSIMEDTTNTTPKTLQRNTTTQPTRQG